MRNNTSFFPDILIHSQFSVIDKFNKKFEITILSGKDFPTWFLDLIPIVTNKDIKLSLLNYPEPLILKIKYTPIQILERIPDTLTTCTSKNQCIAWKESLCKNLVKNKCPLIKLSDLKGGTSDSLTMVYHLLKENQTLVILSE